MICETKGGAVCTVEASKISVGSNDDINLAVYGEKGAIKFSLMEPNWLHFYDAEAQGGNYGGSRGFTKIECVVRYELPGGIFPSFKAPIGWLRGQLHSMYSLLSACHGNRDSLPSFFDGAQVQKVLDMAIKSDNS
jgi:predicted dehydrogenase